MAIARLDRALREFRIRGVTTNIAFVENLLKHPTFLDYSYTTKFIDTTPELFHFTARRDRATKILTYIADITVNGHPETAGRPNAAGRGAGRRSRRSCRSTRRRPARGSSSRRRAPRASPTGCWRRSGSSSPTPRCATATRACSPRGCAPTT